MRRGRGADFIVASSCLSSPAGKGQAPSSNAGRSQSIALRPPPSAHSQHRSGRRRLDLKLQPKLPQEPASTRPGRAAATPRNCQCAALAGSQRVTFSRGAIAAPGSRRAREPQLNTTNRGSSTTSTTLAHNTQNTRPDDRGGAQPGRATAQPALQAASSQRGHRGGAQGQARRRCIQPGQLLVAGQGDRGRGQGKAQRHVRWRAGPIDPWRPWQHAGCACTEAAGAAAPGHRLSHPPIDSPPHPPAYLLQRPQPATSMWCRSSSGSRRAPASGRAAPPGGPAACVQQPAAPSKQARLRSVASPARLRGRRLASRCLWDASTDAHTQETFSNVGCRCCCM